MFVTCGVEPERALSRETYCTLAKLRNGETCSEEQKFLLSFVDLGATNCEVVRGNRNSNSVYFRDLMLTSVSLAQLCARYLSPCNIPKT
jgi:hypothetical protein